MIAMALRSNIDLVADEPTTALDVTTQAQILRLIPTSSSGAAWRSVHHHDFGVVATLRPRRSDGEGARRRAGFGRGCARTPAASLYARLLAASPA